MEQPKSGYLAHGGSENHNRGPIRCAVLDLATGEVVVDEEFTKNHRPGMECGSCQDAALIAILSAVIKSHAAGTEPVIYATDPTALRNAETLLCHRWAVQPEITWSEGGWHPLVVQAMGAIDFDVSRVDLRKWDKGIYGENPLARGRWG